MKRFMYVAIFFCVHVIILVFCSACGKVGEGGRHKELSYTVCDATRIPGELRTIIEEKKENPFRLSYTAGQYMYIAVGYGRQDRDELSVRVSEFYLGDDAICLSTTLISDSQEMKEDCVTYPYLVIKCEKSDLPISYVSCLSQTY